MTNHTKKNYYDIIIVGGGIAGLYSAYNIQKMCPTKSVVVLEKHKKQWIGGRLGNETFYDTTVVTGAGIGRKDKHPLLLQLLQELQIPYTESVFDIHYANTIDYPLDISKVISFLRREYKKNPSEKRKTFQTFAKSILGEATYQEFIISAGYTDYENEDVYETLYHYGMDDNKGGWTMLSIPWKKLIDALCKKIGDSNIKTSNDVVGITSCNSFFEIETNKGSVYTCQKVILATTITSIRELLPKLKIYEQIHGQPFLRLYAKFTKESSKIMQEYVPGYTIVPGPLQKIIPMDAKKGVYMIAYSDNKGAIALHPYLENNHSNRTLFQTLLEKSLGIPENTLHIIAIKDYYWPVGTHYYEPLQGPYKTRTEFIKDAQHPEKGFLVVGEVVSRYQGWTEGALESVHSVLDKKWIDCYR